MTRLHTTIARIGALLGLLLPAPAMAQGDAGAIMPGQATHSRPGTTMGTTGAALPGVYRVASAVAASADATMLMGGGYGLASDVFGTQDAHHRVAGWFAASLRVQPWLALALRLDGRYDRHTGLAAGTDTGMVGDPRLVARAGTVWGQNWQAGTQLTVWIPGRQAPSVVLGATTVDALALLEYQAVPDRLHIAMNAGVRVDRSAASANDADMLSQADRLSLGVSESSAALLGLGATWRLGRIELFGEWTWDLLVGDQAPAMSMSPMRVAAGLRAAVLPAWTVQLAVESRLSRAPSAALEEPLAPFEPRFSIAAGVCYEFDTRASAGPRPSDARVSRPSTGDSRPVPPETQPETQRKVVFSGRVVDHEGAGVAGASVTIEAGETSLQATTGAGGEFRVADVPAGPVRVHVAAKGFVDADETAQARETGEIEVRVTLEPALPSGQLRGLVRSFRGKPVTATLAIEPGGRIVKTDNTGYFEVDVPPGKYTVTVRAPGFREQRRKVVVEEGGVTIINADLRGRR